MLTLAEPLQFTSFVDFPVIVIDGQRNMERSKIVNSRVDIFLTRTASLMSSCSSRACTMRLL